MGGQDARYGYDPCESRASRALDRAWAVGRVALPLAALAYILATGEGGESDVPQENYLVPENGVIASPVVASPEIPAPYILPTPDSGSLTGGNGTVTSTSTAEATPE